MCGQWESTWLKFLGWRDWGSPIPGANVLANIATEDVTAHRFAQSFRNAATKFDGQVGDAEARIHHVRIHERTGGAGIDAFGARAAEVGRGQLGRTECGWNIESRQNHAEKKPGAKSGVQ